MLKVRYLGTVAVVSPKFLNDPRIYIIPSYRHCENLGSLFKLILNVTRKFHSKKDDRVIDCNLGHIKPDMTSGAFHLVWCNARPISTRGCLVQRRKKIKLLKFWVYNPATRRPLRVILAIGEVVYIYHYERTDEGYNRGYVSYTRNDDEVEVAIDDVGTDCDGCHESSYRGTIDFARGYRGLKMIELHENFPGSRTPRIKWD